MIALCPSAACATAASVCCRLRRRAPRRSQTSRRWKPTAPGVRPAWSAPDHFPCLPSCASAAVSLARRSSSRLPRPLAARTSSLSALALNFASWPPRELDAHYSSVRVNDSGLTALEHATRDHLVAHPQGRGFGETGGDYRLEALRLRPAPALAPPCDLSCRIPGSAPRRARRRRRAAVPSRAPSLRRSGRRPRKPEARLPRRPAHPSYRRPARATHWRGPAACASRNPGPTQARRAGRGPTPDAHCR